MTWNYRIVKTHWKLKHLKGEEYSIREVYYDKDGKIKSWTAEPQYLCSESPEGIADDLVLIRGAFKKPILEEKGKKLIEIK